jgi:glycosyltransferase involved in cell wall biosynthesis
LLLNWLQRAKTVMKFHSPAQLIMPTYDVRKADRIACSLVEKIGIRGADAYTSCSRFLADEVRAKMGVRRPIEVIANGIDLELFDTAESIDARTKFGLPKDKLVIFFAGRMEKRKGIHLCPEIVETILKKHDVAFAFAGSDLFGFMEKELLPRLKGQTLKGSVHYLGKLTLNEVGSCLRQSDLYFIPSLWENCPYSCLEAMAAGRAIVASDAGGLPELIADGKNGLIAKSGDAQSFVRQLEKMIEDGPLRTRLGAAARRTVEERYTDTGIARQSVDHWSRALGLKA